MKYLLFFILLAHGALHLIGFAKAFRYAEFTALSQPVSRTAGVFWALAFLLFFAAAVFLFLEKDNWWMWAAPAVVLSQTLIFMSWQDAKFGTVANLLLVLALLPAFGQWRFNRMIRYERAVFTASPLPEAVPVSPEKTAALPPPVRKWLEHSGALNRSSVRRVYLRQKGEMRTAPGGSWMSMTAEQYFSVDPPGFHWTTEVQMMPLLYLSGRDRYADGQGHMLILFWSLFPVADARGKETDQSTLLRYLGETCWFPSAALSDYIRWENLDARSAKATMTWRGAEASAVFYFTEDGDFAAMEADRYYNRKNGPTLERWRVEAKDWKSFGGLRLPAVLEVTWKLKEGDFFWLKLEITEVGFDAAAES